VAARPEIVVLFTSGYTEDAILRHGVLDSVTHFIGKPYTASDLTRKVRSLLDAAEHNAPST
jgi:two-component system, cell cycle sensor histidine kinase and response regulator CckA